ncbi:hypothetical protein NFIA_055860 [Paecilomyces variotii No. 5]|uniref:Peroxisomal biogenesis factor 11 n=1 Tax=Byssochlamys spectabilis (strain No. 5 / NBRC 109023) TaxID=1356009 RepID=V5FYB9_BYSSN|nr:hypothetical protein NFIA_055860 [Paecilomyces variotii No. 5]
MAVSTDTVSKGSKQGRRHGQKKKTTSPSQLVPPSSTGIVKQFTNFTNHGVGLEKTLRLVQALTQAGAEVLIDTDERLAKRFAIARGQIALSRRYFRFFKFLDCFERVSTLFYPRQSEANEGDSVRTALELVKWTCFGIYLAMEDLTINGPDVHRHLLTEIHRQLDAMGVYSTSWSSWMLVEAHKFWFCALSLSLLGSLWMLLVADPKTSASKSSSWVKRIIIDGCDLLIPGSMVGWISVSPLVVAMNMVVSTVLAAQDIWVQAQA